MASIFEPCASFQMRGGHAFSFVMFASVHGPSWMLKVTAGVLWVLEKIPPVSKYIVGDLLLIEGKGARSREPSFNLFFFFEVNNLYSGAGKADRSLATQASS